jgi:hypothetical protein
MAANLCVIAFFGHQLSAVTSRADHLGALAWLQFDSVDSVPTGMFLSGRRLPVSTGASSPLVTNGLTNGHALSGKM